ncbi:MAG: carbohydrate-binding family V/XII [Verrucomicrobiota bacterium]
MKPTTLLHSLTASLLTLVVTITFVIPAGAQTPAAGPVINPVALGWPRTFVDGGYEYCVYQPQIASWPGNQLTGRFAMATRLAGTKAETYGVVFFTARTEIDKVNRLVTLEDFQVTNTKFPTQPDMVAQYQIAIQNQLPVVAKTIPLDHLEAVFAASQSIAAAKFVEVKNDPPTILYTTQPALLVMVDGAPILKPLVGSYSRVVNTRSVLLQNNNPNFQSYFLFAAGFWYAAPSLHGPWIVTTQLPPDLNDALTAAEATDQCDSMLPKAPLTTPPVIYLATTPTELLETTGTPNLLAVNNTDLLYVANTSSAIFYYLDDTNYYVLVSGRWFKSPSLYGPWAYVPPAQMPADFQKIPADNPKSNVMCSVPGTPQAQEAVIANSIPQTATIYRDKATLSVVYVGGPSFVAIPGTGLFYANNTTTPVIMLNPTTYYASQNGVWFTATSALGPWTVATTVPAAIYNIPTSCPIHYVTYSYVYGATPTVVYVGYTPGYMGTIVSSSGVVVYGTGYYYPPVVVGTTYVSYPPTYGYGAAFATGAAVGFAFGYCAGTSSSCGTEPHWGCYSASYYSSYSYTHVNVNATSCYTHYGTACCSSGYHGYNAYTGTSYAGHTASTYNPYTGTKGTVSGTAAYNPYTGNAAAAQSGTWHNPYSSATATANRSVSGNAYTGNYSATKQGSYNNPQTGESADATKTTSGNIYNGTKSTTSSGSASNSKTGNSDTWSNGSMTSDKDGNTYSYNKGDTSQNQSTAQSEKSSGSSSWQDRERSAQQTGQQRANAWGGSGGGGWGGGGGRRR